MAYNEILVSQVREALAELPDVEEKQMFRGVTFMVNGKMCVSVSGNELLCRVSPGTFEQVIEKHGCHEMIHGGKTMKGFVFVGEENLTNEADFMYWINLALEFNPEAKASKKKASRK